MSASLIVEHSDIQVYLRHLNVMGGGTFEVKALVEPVVLLLVALVAVHHVLRPLLSLQVDSVPAGGELDVYFQL